MSDEPDGTDALRFEILGSLRAWRGTRQLDLGAGKQRAVLAVLLVNADRPVSTRNIVDSVWPDEHPANGANVVQKYVAGLRRVLEPERSPRTDGRLLTRTEAGYRLRVGAGRLDSEVFQQRVRRGRAAWAEGRAAEAAAELQGALGLWRSEALAGLSGPLFDATRERLGEERAAALESWAEIELELGHHDRLVPELVRLVAEFPMREQLRRLMMLALYRCGRRAEALAAFRDTREYLSEEFGVEPGQRLQRLHVQMLRSDPALNPPGAPAEAGDVTGAADHVTMISPAVLEAAVAEPGVAEPSVGEPAPATHRTGDPPVEPSAPFARPDGSPPAPAPAHPTPSGPPRRARRLGSAGRYGISGAVPPARSAAAPARPASPAPPPSELSPAEPPASERRPSGPPPEFSCPEPPPAPPPASPGGPWPWQDAAARPGAQPGPGALGWGGPAVAVPPGLSGQAGAQAPPTRQWHWAAALVAFLVPLLSCGLLSWSVIAFMAARRHSRALAVAAAAYLLLVIVVFVVIGSADASDDAPTTLADTVGITCLFAAWAGGVTHVVLLLAAGYTRSEGDHGRPMSDRRSGRRLPDAAVIEAIERRVRREQALGLLDRHPEIARELGIGRPDLPRTFDDGGLIDINAVPEHVLASLPGVTSAQARAIVAERGLSGGFFSVGDLTARGLLPYPIPDALMGRLIAVRPP